MKRSLSAVYLCWMLVCGCVLVACGAGAPGEEKQQERDQVPVPVKQERERTGETGSPVLASIQQVAKKPKTGQFKFPFKSERPTIGTFSAGQLKVKELTRMGQALVGGEVSTGATYQLWDKSIYVSGYFSGEMVVQGKTLRSKGGQDGFVARFDEQGKLLRLLSFGGKGDDRALGIQRDCRNLVYVVGDFTGAEAFGGRPSGRTAIRNGFIARVGDQSLEDVQTYPSQSPSSAVKLSIGNSCSIYVQIREEAIAGRCNVINKDTVYIHSGGTPRGAITKIPLSPTSTYPTKILDIKAASSGAYVLGAYHRYGKLGDVALPSGIGLFLAWIDSTNKVKWAKQIEQLDSITSPQLTGHIAASMWSTAALVAWGEYSTTLKAYDWEGQEKWSKKLSLTVKDFVSLSDSSFLMLAKAGSFTHKGQSFQGTPATRDSTILAELDAQGTFGKVTRVQMDQQGSLQGHLAYGSNTKQTMWVLNNIKGVSVNQGGSTYTSTSAFTLQAYKSQENDHTQLWWTHSGTKNSEAVIEDSAVDKAGHIYRIVRFAGSIEVGGQTLDAKQGWTHVLIKQERSGKRLWHKRLKTEISSAFVPSRLVVSPAGEVTVGMRTYRSLQVDDKVLYQEQSPSSMKIDLLRFSDKGALTWYETLPLIGRTGSYDKIHGLILTNKGDLAVVVEAYNKPSLHLYNSQQQRVKAQEFGGTTQGTIKMAADKDADIYLTGSFSTRTASFGQEVVSRGERVYSGYIAKVTSTGRFLWVRSQWETSRPNTTPVVVSQSGGILLAGTYEGNVRFDHIVLSGERGNHNGFLLKMDTAGKVLWARSFVEAQQSPRSKADESTKMLVEAADGTIYLTGTSQTGARFGQIHTGSGTFLVKLNAKGEAQWSTPMPEQLDQMHTDNTDLLLFGRHDKTQLTFGTQTFSLNNNNTDLSLRLTPQ